MAAGTPAIVANRASLPEVTGGAGVIVDPKKTTNVVGKVSKIAENEALRKKVIKRGQKRAQKYTWKKCVDRIICRLKKVKYE
jgi:glycosyltransferase involved in cell wall biosynthesis